MHRHGYQGRKFGRERDQRQALIKSLAESLVLQESIKTTLPKAKELSSYTEKLITKAKKGDLHNRRQVIKSLNTLEAAHKLVDEIAPKLSGRNSGYLRIERSELRRGDNAQMATITFVDDLSSKPDKPTKKEEPAAKTEEVKPAVAKPAVRKRTAAKKDTA
jgi:large subunit ribosomal protein L17